MVPQFPFSSVGPNVRVERIFDDDNGVLRRANLFLFAFTAPLLLFPADPSSIPTLISPRSKSRVKTSTPFASFFAVKIAKAGIRGGLISEKESDCK